MERYIVFVKDMKSGEEFTIAKMAAKDQYDMVRAQAEEKYKYPNYQIHMVYTQADLENVITTLNRWYGPVESSVEQMRQQSEQTRIQHEMAQRAEWDKMVNAFKQRQQDKSNFVKQAVGVTPTTATTTVKN